MKTIQSIMTREVESVAPETSLIQAASLMERLNVGSLPVCRDGKLVGMVTDRDITVRGVAKSLDMASPVAQVMTGDPVSARDDDAVDDVERVMRRAQIRRVPILNVEGELVGIVALGDLATRQKGDLDEVVRDISAPAPAA